MKADDAKRLKELERENARLKRIVADQAIDIDALREVSRDAPIDRQVTIAAKSALSAVNTSRTR